MAATEVSFVMVDNTFTVTTTDGTVHDLTGVLHPDELRLTYGPPSGDGSPIVRVGLVTAKFVVTTPTGQPITFDRRTGVALGRLGWAVPRS